MLYSTMTMCKLLVGYSISPVHIRPAAYIKAAPAVQALATAGTVPSSAQATGRIRPLWGWSQQS